MACLFGIGILVFLVARGLFVPKGFGDLGHFRPGAIADNQARKPSFAGKEACLQCHGAVQDAMKQKASRHLKVSCEACHGAQIKHATDPASGKPEPVPPVKLCLTCHSSNVAKPPGFKQVDPKQHNEGVSCTDCHSAHSPGMQEVTK
jgi:hypothetical protein